MEGAEKYDRVVDKDGSSSVAQLLRWIRPGSKVLEFGPATGAMTRLLFEHSRCDITCVEVDAKAAESAQPFCSRMIVGDLNDTQWAQGLSDERFDYIIFADVLEHLLDPARALSFSLTFLKPGGEVLISVPNIGYIGVISELLQGRFNYRRDGLLDETHVHFFTRESLVRLLRDAGLVSVEWSRTTVAPEFSEFRLQTNQLGAAVRGVLAAVPDGDTYQFLVRASLTGVAAAPEVPAMRELARTARSAQIFFDRGEGFGELDSVVLPLRATPDVQTLRVECPKGTKSIRLDPIDTSEAVTIRSMSISDTSGALFSWTASYGPLRAQSSQVNVVEVHLEDLSVFVPANADPCIIIPVNATSAVTFTVDISLDASQVLQSLTEVLIQARRDRASIGELSERYNTMSAELHDAQVLVEKLQRERDALEASFRHAQQVLNGVVSSRSWKMTRPLRFALRLARVVPRLVQRWLRKTLRDKILSAPGYPVSELKKFVWRKAKLGSEYELRLLESDPSAQELTEMRNDQALVERGPLFSILMPTYKTSPHWLKDAIESVRAQTYSKWELCIADDASDDPGVRSILSTYAAGDQRIKVSYLDTNGHISRASNAALELVTGEYVVLLDHDDLLAPHALHRLAQKIQVNPKVDVIYSDEDKISLDGRVRSEPTCKPAWSPDYFLSFMYTGHISCFRATVVREVGGFREGFEGSQDYDLMLRVTERTDAVEHIPEVLYHWRVHEQSVAGNLLSKPYAFTAAKRALSEALQRRGFKDAVVRDSRTTGLYRIERGRKGELLGVVTLGGELDDRSVSSDLIHHFESGQEQAVVKGCLELARGKTGSVLLVVGAKVDSSVLDRLRDHASDRHVGVVAPLIVDSHGTVIAAGESVVDGSLRPNFIGIPAEDVGYRGRLAVPFNVSCVRPTCVLVSREVLDRIPETVSTVRELVAFMCAVARRAQFRCLVDPTVAVEEASQGAVEPLSRQGVSHIFGGTDGRELGDPFLPAGLRRYVGCVEMPSV